MEVISAITLIALIWKAVDFVKFVTNKDVNSTVTQVTVWVAGIGVSFLAAESNVAQNIVLAGTRFADMNTGSLVLIGLLLGSTSSAVVDLKKARDNNDTAATPSLLPRKARRVRREVGVEN